MAVPDPQPARIMKTITTILASLLFAGHAFAVSSPYSGQLTRAIKALSDDDISGYLTGHGMGLARPAELNGYPGPRHVLDSADELKLTPEQAAALNRVFAAMHAAALPLGATIVAKETELDRLFSGRRALDTAVSALTGEIGRLQGELRAVHLNAHLATVKILTLEQVAAYNRLRGYAGTATPAKDHPGHKHGTP